MARPQLLDLFTRHPIADALFPYLTLADVYKLRRVCKLLQSVMLRLQDAHLNIQCALKDFLKSSDSFRYILGRAGALVVGPFVVNFLGYRQYDNSFLDILVERGPLAENLIQYLCAEEAYQHVGVSDVGDRVTLSRSGFTTKIRVTKTDKAPIHTLLASACTTLDLCFMSWNKVYSVFPLATLVHHQFWPLRRLNDVFGARLAELATQGWNTRHLVWADLAEEPLSGLGARRVGDKESLVLPLTPALASTGLTPDYVLELSEFAVHTYVPTHDFSAGQARSRPLFPQIAPSRSTVSPELTIILEELKSASLRHRYTTRKGSSWPQFALHRLKRWTEIELYKLDHDERPTNFPNLLPSPDFEVPVTWDFADDQMPIWYRRWCSQNGRDQSDFHF